MQTREQFYRAKQIASAPATPEKIHVYKTGENAGKTRKLNAKPARQGILPISEKLYGLGRVKVNFRSRSAWVVMSLSGELRTFRSGLRSSQHEQHPIKASPGTPQAR